MPLVMGCPLLFLKENSGHRKGIVNSTQLLFPKSDSGPSELQ